MCIAICFLSMFNVYQTFADNYAIRSSINEIIHSVYANQTLFMLCDKIESLQSALPVASSSSSIVVQIESFNHIKELPERRRHAIFFIASFASFTSFHEAMTDKLFDFGGLYLIVCSGMTTNHVNAVFRLLWQKFIYNVGILMTVDDAVTLQTFFPFNHQKCFDMTAKTINVFNSTTFKWTSYSFFPRKLTSLYNCPIKVTTFEYEPAIIVKKFENGSFELHGSDMELLNGLAKVLNFRIDLIFLPNFGDWGVLYENGTATGAHKMVIERKTDAIIGWFYVSYLKTLFMSNSEPYFMVPLAIIVPSGKAYTTLEKLLIPFELSVWVWLLVALILAVLVILTVEIRFRNIRKFVIGNEVKTPLMELLVVLFGSSSHSLPRQHFPRYLLTMFLIFCLVMRTLYQSGLFKYMQSDKTGSGIASIDEMIEEKFTIYSYLSVEPFWRQMKFSGV